MSLDDSLRTRADLCSILVRASVICQREERLSDAVKQLLDEAGIKHEQEVRLTPRDRIDFMVGRVGIELKIIVAAPPVIRQLHRYAESDLVDCLILVTTSRKLASSMPRTLLGKSITTVCIGGGL